MHERTMHSVREGNPRRGEHHDDPAWHDVDSRRHRRSRSVEPMSHRVITLVTACAAVGCGLIAGVFFAFSISVMSALARLPAAQGIVAMNAINVAIINRVFMAALFGTAAACAVLAVSSLFAWSEPGARFRLGGCVVYLAGAILVTRAFNIPRNDGLAATQPDSPEGAALWARYLVEWVAWNHVRTATCLAAAALLTVALLCRSR
jgi:uncharacterized membrane protein